VELQVSYSNCVLGWTSERNWSYFPAAVKDIFFCKASEPALGLVQVILWALSQKIK